jgi:hypothetical protein
MGQLLISPASLEIFKLRENIAGQSQHAANKIMGGVDTSLFIDPITAVLTTARER